MQIIFWMNFATKQGLQGAADKASEFKGGIEVAYHSTSNISFDEILSSR